MNDVYTAPQSELNTTNELELTFSSLGFWRKFYVVFNWLATSLMMAFFALGGFLTELGVGTTAIVIISVLILAYSYWVHVAIARRSLTQLTILTVIQVIPFLNPISAIILFAIRSTSKKELA